MVQPTRVTTRMPTNSAPYRPVLVITTSDMLGYNAFITTCETSCPKYCVGWLVWSTVLYLPFGNLITNNIYCHLNRAETYGPAYKINFLHHVMVFVSCPETTKVGNKTKHRLWNPKLGKNCTIFVYLITIGQKEVRNSFLPWKTHFLTVYIWRFRKCWCRQNTLKINSSTIESAVCLAKGNIS